MLGGLDYCFKKKGDSMYWLNDPSNLPTPTPREDVGDCTALACGSGNAACPGFHFCIGNNCHGNCTIYF